MAADRPKKTFVRALLKLAVAAVVLLIVIAVAGHFYVNRGAFIRTHVLPVAADALGQPIEAESIEFTALSHIGFAGLKLGDSLLTAKKIDLRYNAVAFVTQQQVEVTRLHIIGVDLVYDLAAAKKKSDPAPAAEFTTVSAGGIPAILIEDVMISEVNATVIDGPMKIMVRDLSIESAQIATGSDFEVVVRAGFEFTDGTTTVRGELEQTEKGRVSDSLEEIVLDLALTIRDLVIEAPGVEPPKYTLTLTSGASLTGLSAVTVDSLALTVQAADAMPLVKVELKKPLSLDLNAPGIPDAHLSAALFGFDIALAKSFLPNDETFSIAAGMLNAHVELKGKEAVNAGIRFEKGILKAQGEVFSNVGLDVDVRAEIPDWSAAGLPLTAVVKQGGCTLRVGKGEVLTANVAGRIDLEDPAQSTLTLQAATKPKFAKIAGGIAGQDLGEPMVTVDAKVGEKAVLALSVKGLNVSSIVSGQVKELLDIQVKAEGSLGEETITVSSYVVACALGKDISATVQGTDVVASLQGFKLQEALEPAYRVNVQSLAALRGVLPEGLDVDAMIGVEGIARVEDLEKLSVSTSGKLAVSGVKANFPQGQVKGKPALTLTYHTTFEGGSLAPELSLIVRADDLQPVNVNVIGQLFLPAEAGTQAKKSTLQVSVPTPVDAMALSKLWQANEQAEDEEVSEDVEDAASELPNIWVEATADVKHATYGDLQITGLDIAASVKDGEAKLTKCNAKLNGSPLSVTGAANLKDKTSPFAANVSLDALDLAPVLSTFAPKLPVALTGSLNTLKVDAKGAGSGWEEIRDQLVSNLTLDVDKLKIGPGSGTSTMVAAALPLIGLSWDDFDFIGGKAVLSTKDGQLNLQPVSVHGNSMLLGLSGAMSMATWAPEMKLELGAKNSLARNMKANQISLTNNGDGYEYAPPLMISKNWGTVGKGVLSWVPNGAILNLFTGGGSDKGDGGGLKGLLNAVMPDSGAEDKASGEKAGSGAAIQGILGGLLGGGAQPTPEAPAATVVRDKADAVPLTEEEKKRQQEQQKKKKNRALRGGLFNLGEQLLRQQAK